jgi:AcrR family transcriptional regulator
VSPLPVPADPDTYSPGALAILEAAERLIGRHGIEGTSMRQITLAAKMANNSAIAYHFGDRDGLLRAISRWRAGLIEQERSRLFNQAEAVGEGHNPVRIVQIITRPLLAVRADDGSHPHAAFVSQMLRSRLGREIRHSVYGQTVSEMVNRLHRHAPALSRLLFEFRLRTGSLAFYDAIVERDQMAADDPARLATDDEGFLAELDAMLLAIILREPC